VISVTVKRRDRGAPVGTYRGRRLGHRQDFDQAPVRWRAGTITPVMTSGPTGPGTGGNEVDGGSDLVLARRSGFGDRRAFAELVRRHSPAMLRFARRMLGDDGDAEDAVQEAFLSAWRGLEHFRGDSAVRTWLFRLVASKALNSRRARRPLPVDAETLRHQPDAASEPSARAQDARLLAALQTALDGLPPGQRSCWLLREVEGLGYVEIADVLGTSRTAVRGQLSRARDALAVRMAPWR